MNRVLNAGRTTTAIIPGQRVVFSGEHASVPIPAQTNSREPKIELVRENDVIRAIDVTCACGQRIRLVCDYPEEETAK